MKIKKVEEFVAKLHDNTEYVIDILTLNQRLNHGLSHGDFLKKDHRLIKFNEEAWLKPYIDMNTELSKKQTNDFQKDFFKLINNSSFGKSMENEMKHRDIKLVTTEDEETIWCQKVIILQSF